jgi:DNA polymerase bacteriophage-type
MRLWLDTETRGPNFRFGNAKYALTVEVIMAQFAVDNGPVVVIDLTNLNALNSMRLKSLCAAAERADEVWAHEAGFDRTMLNTTEWWPEIPLERWRCTAALARMHGLMGGLDKLCKVFKIDESEAKDAEGINWIKLFSTPKKDGTFNDRHSHPAEWTKFLKYGGADVTAMRTIWRQMPKWNATPRMWSIYHLDQRMNDRGVAVDLKLAQGAVDATVKAKELLKQAAFDASLGEVESTTQVAKLKAYCAEFGVYLPDLTADTVERRLEDEALPEHIKELLRVRQQASKASTAKYLRAINQQVDGRLRNLLVFCGAARTGRWAGRTLQPQNLPRPKHEQWDIDHAIGRFRDGTIFDYAPKEVLGLASSCLRGLIVASDGRKLVTSDLKNIEGRIIAWVAGEEWKLEAFRAYDRKEGPDLYKIAYARAFNIDPDQIGDKDERRQIGKVMELALQYYGGVGAFCSMAEVYGLRLEHLATSAWPVIPDDFKRDAKTAWAKAVKRRHTYELEERIWTVCHALVLMWRAAHLAICAFWGELDRACSMAIKVKNKEYYVGNYIIVDRVVNWLRIRLPSGRYLNYPSPQGDDYTSSFMGIDPYTKQWKRLSTYSGKRAQNIAEGIGADILGDGLLAADTAGYNPVLSVHDEGITEPPDSDEYNDEDLNRILVSSSDWATEFPLAADGFTDYRYHK